MSSRPFVTRSSRAVVALVTVLVASLVVGVGPVSAAEPPAANSVTAYGAAAHRGPDGGMQLHADLVGIAAHPSGDGYWAVAGDGGVFSFGAAAFHGSAGDIALNQPIVGMAAHPSGEGYWFVAADGGVFSFGAAEFQGSMGHRSLPAPVRGMAAHPSGDGYWLVGADGEVYEQGVGSHGGASGDRGLAPLTVGIAAHPVDSGYWLAHGGMPTLERADSGPHVEQLQRRLEELGYWIGPIDGVFGYLTEQAVWAFQKYEGLPPDGVVGDSTRAALDRASRVQARSTSGDIVEIDKNRQLTFIVRDGHTVWVFNSPTGEEEYYRYEGETYFSETPTGRFEMFRQIDGWRESHLGRLYRPKYFTTNGIALHGYTDVPPFPASHGCVRVSMAAMDHIWAHDLVPIGIDVWVYGTIPS